MYSFLSLKKIRFLIFSVIVITLCLAILFNISPQGEIGALNHAIMV